MGTRVDGDNPSPGRHFRGEFTRKETRSATNIEARFPGARCDNFAHPPSLIDKLESGIAPVEIGQCAGVSEGAHGLSRISPKVRHSKGASYHPHPTPPSRGRGKQLFRPLSRRKASVGHSIRRPIAFTTLAYLSVSLFRYALARSGVDGAGSTPIPA